MAPIAFFYWVVHTMVVNVPFQDDFDGLLEPVLYLHQHTFSFSEFWQVLSTQDDERRIIIDRLAAYMTYLLSGHLNLRAIIVVGALNLLVFLWVILQWFRSTNTSWLLFIAIPWLLFNIQFYEAIFWAMIPLQHLAAFVWAISTMWLLSRNSQNTFIGAILTALLTISADVSGTFILVAGMVVLIAQQRWRAAGWWAAIIGIVVWFYFSGLVIPEYRPKFSDNFSDPLLGLSILSALFGLWADPGPGFPMTLRQGLSIVLGISSIAFVLFFFIRICRKTLESRKPLEKDDAFLWGAICFITIVLVVLAAGRAAEGLTSVFKPRYRHMYVFWLILMYLLAIRYQPQWFGNSRVKVGIIAASILFCLNSYHAYWGGLDQFRKTLLTDAYQWYHNRSLPSSPIYLSLRDRVDSIYEGVYNAGIYQPEEYPFASLPMAPVEGNIEIDLFELDHNVEVEIKNFRRKSGKDDGAYVLFKAENGETHILSTYHSVRPLHRMLSEGSYYYPGAQINRYGTAYFKSDVFDVEIGVIEGDRQYRLITGKQLRL